MIVLVCASFTGCAGKSLVADNPVFSETPPRIDLTNRATATTDKPAEESVIHAISHTSAPELTGNTIVAKVNGRPIFVDDLVGSMRVTLEEDPRVSVDQRNQILHTQIQGRLKSYVDQEIVLQALRKKIPEDRQDDIRASLETPFQEVLGNIKRDNKVETEDELNGVLAQQGLSIDLLRESFLRIQMVQGYISSVAEVSDTVDRIEMVKYYDEHKEDFTSEERVRCQEIVVQFGANGGRDGAEEKMATVVKELQAGSDFAELAIEYSDALSSEKRGDMGWLTKGSLADKDVENTLFALAEGKMTKVYVRDDRFEVYRVSRHEDEKTESFQEVQQRIEEAIKSERRNQARADAIEKLRENAVVVTMYDKEEGSTKL